ncbi:MAG TPA: triose-phosphate isomerase [Thermoanaerobaculia bacterium]|nr:triose-phosphate isomerase [Thermoanaerobaculia bacterium]
MTGAPSAPERRLVAANWKMHLLRAEAIAFCRGLGELLPKDAAPAAIFPGFPLLPAVAAELAGSFVAVGAQDIHPDDQGAHTGDVSGPQIADAGATWVLCGHSERRRDHAESDERVGRKVAAAFRNRLSPLLCVGETREERRAGHTFEVLARQLEGALAQGANRSLAASGAPRFALAYEPVWAIGTGEVATPETASEAHVFLRDELSRQLGAAAAGTVPLLYGGSVAPENAPALAVSREVDGFLVGGASLDLGRFLSIISAFGRATT